MSSPAVEPERLFFALWPDEPVRQRLDDLARRVVAGNGRRVPAAKLHLTLVFLGHVTAPVRQCAEAAAAEVAAPAFVLTLDRVGQWRRRGIIWAGPQQAPAALLELVRALTDVLIPCGFEPEQRPFAAHLTLARRSRRAVRAAAVDPVHWPVSEFALVRSETGAGGSAYRVLGRWPLRSPQP